MEILITIVLLYVAAQTTYLTVRSIRRTPLGTGGKRQAIFVDTSVLIDGRIIALAQSGFIMNTLSIPRSVIGELQFLADHGDTDKRTRARHGLDVVNQLQEMKTVTVEIFPDTPRAEEGVDNRLLSLSKKHNGVLCTIDFNLNKVAQVEGIRVLNVNDLAKSLRMAYLPGERLMLELTTKGSDSHQAVGHLTDGTMVVVEHANAAIGSTREVEFIRSLQTAAGKMLFARLVDTNVAPKQPTKAVKGRKPLPAVAKVDKIEKQTTRPPKTQKSDAAKDASRQEAASRAKSAIEAPRQQNNNGGGNNNKRPNQQRSRRPKTNEDRLVELANS